MTPKKGHEKGFTVFIVLALVLILLFTPLAGSATMGSVFGAHAREGTIPEGGSYNQDLGPIPQSCNGVIGKARDYINKGIEYSQKMPPDHCAGPGIGPESVQYIDCSGYASRVYRDAGLFSQNVCLNTVGLAYSGQLTRIATDVATAKQVAEPGDILLFGLGSPSGSPTKTSASHAVIYAGNDTAYESGGSGGGPHFSSSNVWGHGRVLYGVYRAQTCGLEAQKREEISE